jgi:hypothetical protein
MKTETPERKKSWDKEPISKCEWGANQTAVNIVRDEDSAEFRLKLKRKIATVLGSDYNPGNAKSMHVKMATHLIKIGLLTKPEWHSKSTLHLDHFPTEDLAECYTAIKENAKPPELVIDPDLCPF